MKYDEVLSKMRNKMCPLTELLVILMECVKTYSRGLKRHHTASEEMEECGISFLLKGPFTPIDSVSVP